MGGEDLELVVQFFPGVSVSQMDWEALLASWAQQTEATQTFQSHLMAATGDRDKMSLSPWEAMRQKHYTSAQASAQTQAQAPGDAFDHCALPTSTSVEFHPSSSEVGGGTVGKFVDLSGFLSSSSLFCLVKLLEVLSAQPNVLALSILPRPILLNYDARGLLQSGVAGKNPLTDIGLLGEGQVVGVADSGLDDKSCFFWDNSNSYSSVYTTRNNGGGGTLEANRRKVVQYTAYADGYDNAAGHGTHVAGIITGNSIR